MARDFTLTFDGPALAERRMPVRDLAPSLLAMGSLFQRVQAVVDPMATPVSLEVRAFNDGSFEAALHLSQQDIVTLMSSPPAVAIGNLVGLVCNSGQGLFALIKWLKNRGIVRRSEPQPGTTRIEDNHGNVFIANTMVFQAFDDLTVRELSKDVVQPLRKPGVRELRIDRTAVAEEPLRVEDDDVEAFEAAVGATQERVQERTLSLRLIGPVFKRSNKWRFSDGTRDDLWAAIQDENLWRQVAVRQELFGAGDVLVCRVVERQTLNAAGAPVDTELTIIEVLEHHPGTGPPPELFDEDQS